MRRLTLSALAAATVAAAAPATAAAAAPPETLAPAPHVITTWLDGVPMTETYDGGGGLPYLGSSSPYNAGDWENVLRAYHDSGVYLRQIAKVDRVADRWVRRVSRRAAHRYHARRLAMVLDIDETSLSNYSAIEADNFTYGPNSRAEAVNQVGVAIRPTLRLFRLAKRRGIRVFFITGRPEAQRQPTRQNLAREGYRGYRRLYLKPAGSTQSTVQYKTGARQDIESRGFRIVANVGDQYSDLAGGHAQRAFKLANPFYFLP